MNRPVMYTLDVVVNKSDSDRNFDHPKMDFEDLMAMLDSYVIGDSEETSWVFTVVKHIPKDWVVFVDTDGDLECFGPFTDSQSARYWGEENIGSVTDWHILAIDKAVPKSLDVAEFNQAIAGDR